MVPKVCYNLEEFRLLLTAAVTDIAVAFHLICVIDDPAVAAEKITSCKYC